VAKKSKKKKAAAPRKPNPLRPYSKVIGSLVGSVVAAAAGAGNWWFGWLGGVDPGALTAVVVAVGGLIGTYAAPKNIPAS
jgi:hypothetical protein